MNIYENPEENSILYSGSINVGSNDERVLVAAGTVLNGVIVWDLETGKTLHNLTAHEGSIFGVRFSPDNKYLLSCSDDRCIILWDLETSLQVAAGWGHLARIWDIKFYRYQSSNQLTVVSASEDCTARVWTLQGDKLVTARVMEGHLGRNTWCCALDDVRGVLATSGSDGRVRLWDLDEPQDIDQNRRLLSVPGQGKEVFKSFKILGETIVLTTSAGNVYSFTGDKYKRIADAVSNDSYLIVKGWASAQAAVVAYRDGSCLIISSEKTIKMENPLKAKLTDIHTWEFGDKYYLLAQSQNPKDPFVVTIFDKFLELESQIGLTPAQTFLPISLEMVSSTSLFLGSRHGAVAYYDFAKSIEPQGCWRQVFSSDGITSLKFDETTSTLHMTSRGGFFGAAQIEFSPLEFNLVSSNKLQRGSIEGQHRTPDRTVFWGFRNDLFFVWNETEQYEIMNEKCGGPHRNWDFDMNTRTVFAYSKTSQVMVMQSPREFKFGKTLLQDGTHGREIRAIAFWPGEGLGDHTKVVATASEDTCIHVSVLDTLTGALSPRCVLPKHVSGIQALKWSRDGEYLYSSGGREEFFIWRVRVIPRLDELPDVYATPVAIVPPSTDVADLRIMDFAVVRIKGTNKDVIVAAYSDSALRVFVYDGAEESFKLVGQGRYRTCCLLNCNLIVDAYTSSAMLIISSTDGHVVGWNLTFALQSHCGIVVKDGELVEQEGNPNDKRAEFELGPWDFRLQIHQSSVKDSILISRGAGLYHHIGGGDDNALSLSTIQIEGSDGSVSADKLDCVESAHASTVTGLARTITVADGACSETTTFVSVGVDQNVRSWRVGDGEKLEMEKSVYTTVADTGCVASTCGQGSADEKEGNIVLLGGLGLSYWSCCN